MKTRHCLKIAPKPLVVHRSILVSFRGRARLELRKGNVARNAVIDARTVGSLLTLVSGYGTLAKICCSGTAQFSVSEMGEW